MFDETRDRLMAIIQAIIATDSEAELDALIREVADIERRERSA